jgi:hypothetical protein
MAKQICLNMKGNESLVYARNRPGLGPKARETEQKIQYLLQSAIDCNGDEIFKGKSHLPYAGTTEFPPFTSPTGYGKTPDGVISKRTFKAIMEIMELEDKPPMTSNETILLALLHLMFKPFDQIGRELPKSEALALEQGWTYHANAPYDNVVEYANKLLENAGSNIIATWQVPRRLHTHHTTPQRPVSNEVRSGGARVGRNHHGGRDKVGGKKKNRKRSKTRGKQSKGRKPKPSRTKKQKGRKPSGTKKKGRKPSRTKQQSKNRTKRR